MKRKTRSVTKTDEMEHVRSTRYRASTDPLYRLPPELTLHFLSFLKPCERRYLSQASKGHRDFVATKGLIQYELGSAFSFIYYQGLMGWEINVALLDIDARGGKVIKLDLSERLEILDVSRLGSIATLDLSGCKNIAIGLASRCS